MPTHQTPEAQAATPEVIKTYEDLDSKRKFEVVDTYFQNIKIWEYNMFDRGPNSEIKEWDPKKGFDTAHRPTDGSPELYKSFVTDNKGKATGEVLVMARESDGTVFSMVVKVDTNPGVDIEHNSFGKVLMGEKRINGLYTDETINNGIHSKEKSWMKDLFGEHHKGMEAVLKSSHSEEYHKRRDKELKNTVENYAAIHEVSPEGGMKAYVEKLRSNYAEVQAEAAVAETGAVADTEAALVAGTVEIAALRSELEKMRTQFGDLTAEVTRQNAERAAESTRHQAELAAVRYEVQAPGELAGFQAFLETNTFPTAAAAIEAWQKTNGGEGVVRANDLRVVYTLQRGRQRGSTPEAGHTATQAAEAVMSIAAEDLGKAAGEKPKRRSARKPQPAPEPEIKRGPITHEPLPRDLPSRRSTKVVEDEY